LVFWCFGVCAGIRALPSCFKRRPCAGRRLTGKHHSADASANPSKPNGEAATTTSTAKNRRRQKSSPRYRNDFSPRQPIMQKLPGHADPADGRI
jgi:hypothetical protein